MLWRGVASGHGNGLCQRHHAQWLWGRRRSLTPKLSGSSYETGNKRKSAEISSTDTKKNVNISAFGSKQGKGAKTGVQLWYHKNEEYQKLSHEQRKELDEWRRSTNQGKYSKDKKAKTEQKKVAFAAAVEKQVAEKLKSIEEANK